MPLALERIICSQLTTMCHRNMIPNEDNRVETRSSAAHSNNCRFRVALQRTMPQTEKSVAFSPTVKVRTYSPCGEKSKLYYSKQDFNTFRVEAKTIIRNLGTLLLSHDSMTVLESDDDAKDSVRGLELLMFRRRAQNKHRAQRWLLRYQKLLNSKLDLISERKHMALSMVSAKINSWSSAVAAETARLDAIRACDGGCLIPFEAQSVTETDVLPLLFKKRRQRCPGAGRATLDLDGASQPTKRRRTGRDEQSTELDVRTRSSGV